MKATSRDKRSSFATQTEARCFLARLQCGLQLRALRQCIGALAGFGLGIFGNDGQSLGLGKCSHGGPLPREAEPGFLLLLGRDPVIGDNIRHEIPFHLDR